MTRFALLPALALSAALAQPALAVDSGGGDTGGGGTGGGETGGGTGDSGPTSRSTSHGASFTPLDQARGAVREGRYVVALKRLQRIVARDPGNADAWNLLGFSHRMLGQLDQSALAYLKVLEINPDHLGALEYQGELFITQGKLRSARANLARLQDLCGDCEEAQDLQEALAGG